MTRVSASDFAAWRQNPVTLAFFSAALQRIFDATHSLTQSAGIDSVQDSFTRGFITAYRELETFRIDDLDEDQVETESEQ